MAGKYGQFTGYEVRPDGGYNFLLENGGYRASAPTEEAEKIKARLDATRDERTAGLDWKGALKGAASTLVPGFGLASLAASDADAKGKADVPASAAPVAAPRVAPAAAVQAAPVAAAPSVAAPAAEAPNDWIPYKTSESGHQILLRKGGDPADPRDLREVIPGRAATKGGLVMKGQTVSDAEKLDPGKLAAIEGVSKSEADARNESALRVEAIAKQRQELMAADKLAAENQAAVQFHENAVKANELKKLQAQYDDAKKEYADMPNAQAEREKAGNSGLSGLARALSVSLGALGAGMARTPNFAAEALERDAERRMRRDEAELRVKKDSVNLLGELKDKLGGSLDVAKAAYMAIDAKKTAMGYEMLASKEQDQAKAENLRQLARQEWKGHLKWDEEVTRRAEGKISKSFAMTQGSAGSAGGVRSVMGRDVDKRDPNAPGAKPDKLSDTAANNLANLSSAKSLMSGMGDLSDKAGTILNTGFGGSDESQQWGSKVDSLVRIAGKAIEGDAAAESHVEQLKEGLNSASPAKRKHALTELYNTLDTKERELRGVVPGAQGVPR